MGSGMSADNSRTSRGVTVTRSGSNMDVKNKLSHDVKKITSAAAKLKLAAGSKRKADKEKEKMTSTVSNRDQPQEATPQPEKQPEQQQLSKKEQLILDTKPATKASSEQLRRPEKRWTLTDLLHCLGTYVHHECKGLLTRPTAPEVAMWIRCTDKALHLNGWTVNSFLLESHIVFTFMLLQKAFEKFEVRSLADAKELVLMALYISYTYNANEISYPLRPFLVKQDRVSFWAKCTDLSLHSSSDMLRINRDNIYYTELVHQLKRYSITYTYH